MNNKPTLCWTCKNAVPNFKKKIGCSWSIALEPVAGWDAEQHCVDGVTSYRVDSCPYYICDKKDYNKGKELKEYHLIKDEQFNELDKLLHEICSDFITV